MIADQLSGSSSPPHTWTISHASALGPRKTGLGLRGSADGEPAVAAFFATVMSVEERDSTQVSRAETKFVLVAPNSANAMESLARLNPYDLTFRDSGLCNSDWYD